MKNIKISGSVVFLAVVLLVGILIFNRTPSSPQPAAVGDATSCNGTFGNTAVGTNADTGWLNYKSATGPFYVPGCSVSKITAYIDGNDVGANGFVKGAIFTDNGGVPGTLVATTSEVAVNSGLAPGWVDFNFSSTVTLPTGSYWLSLHSGSGRLKFYYTAGSGGPVFNSDTYSDGVSSSFGTANVNSYIFNIYATLTGGSALGPASSPAPTPTPPPTSPSPTPTPATPPVTTGNPTPGAGSSILLDTRAGGANSIQAMTDISQLFPLLKAANNNSSVYIWPEVRFTTNFDGNGTHAIRFETVQQTGDGGPGDVRFGMNSSVPRPKSLYVQWKHFMGRTPTGGGIGALGAFDITNENSGNAISGRKYLLLCRPPIPDDGGCGKRIEHTWGGPSPVVPHTSSDALNLTYAMIPSTCFRPEDHIGEVITFTEYVQAASSQTASDGVIRVWYNGVLCLNITDAKIWDNGIRDIEFPSTFNNPKFDMTEYMWDILVWTPTGGSSTPPPSPTPTPTPVPPPAPSPSTKFSVGDRVQTTTGVNVRASASATGTLLGTQATGIVGTVVSGGTSVDGFYWWNVNYDSGVDGYSAENFLQDYVALIVPPPSPSSASGAEPAISSASSVIWTDNLNDVTGISAGQSSTPLESRYALSPGREMEVITGRGGSGKAIRHNMTTTSFNIMERTFNQTARDHLVFQYWFRFSPGADVSMGGAGYSGMKWLLIGREDSNVGRRTFGISDLNNQVIIDATGVRNTGREFTSADGDANGFNHGDYVLPQNISKTPKQTDVADGNWHRYTVELKGAPGGYTKIWVDGTRIIDTTVLANTTIGNTVGGYYRIDLPSNINLVIPGQEFNIDVDDLAAWVPGTGSSTPPPSPTPTPTPVPPPAPSPSTKFSVGDRVQTTTGVNVRASASATGTLLGTQATGIVGTVVSGGTSVDGFYWWNVNYDSGVDGYSAENFLQDYVAPLPPPAPPAPAGANPVPTSGDSVILDTRAGGAQDMQAKSTMAEVAALINAACQCHTYFGDAIQTTMAFTTNFNGAGKHAIVSMFEGVGTSYADSGNTFQFRIPDKTKLYVQWKQWMGRTATGGGIGNIGAFDISNENDPVGNAGRKILLLCRPTALNPGGCGPRVDHVWTGGSSSVPGTTISTPYNTGTGVPLSCFAPDNNIAREVTFTQYFQASSSDTASDGILRIWYNGVLCAERTDLKMGAEAVTQASLTSTFRSPKFDMTEYLWDILIWSPAGGTNPPPPSPTPTPTPVPPPAPSPSTNFNVGDRIQTTSSLNVRSLASLLSTLLGTQASGALGSIVSGGTSSDGFFWWNVNYDSGVDGYSAENFLQDYVAPTPPPVLPPPPSVILPSVPGTPNFSITTAGSTTSSVRATWTVSSGATSYRYTSGLNSGSSWNGQNGTSSTNNVTLSSVPNGASIYFCVTGVNSSGDSADSACASYFVPAVIVSPPPSPVSTDDDNDGILDTADLCPATQSGVTVNTKGCPLPKMSTFSTKPVLTNTDLRSVGAFEIGNSQGKVSFTQSNYQLLKNMGSYYAPLDIDANLKISNGTIDLSSSGMPELNRPATLTFYNVAIAHPELLRDGNICDSCNFISYQNNTLVFSVPGFSRYTIK